MGNLKELGDINVSFYYNGKIRGCRRTLYTPLKCYEEGGDEIYARIKKQFDGKFLMDNRYTDKGYWEGDKENTYRRTKDDLKFWYDTKDDVHYLRIEKAGAIEYVDNVEDILYSDSSVDFLTEPVFEFCGGVNGGVFAKKPAYDFQFNYLTGILQGGTAGVDVWNWNNKGLRQRFPIISQFICDMLDGAYVANTAKVLYNDEDKAKVTDAVGFPPVTDDWATHFGLIYEEGEDSVLMSDCPLFCLQKGITTENLIAVIKKVWVREIGDCTVEILGFN